MPPEQPEDERMDPPAGDDLLAGEYVLGVLGADLRREVQARIEADREFARRIADWERRLDPLFEEIASADAPAGAWPGIRRRLGWERESMRPAGGGLWRSLGLWRSAAAFGLALAVAAALVDRTPQPVPTSVSEEQAARPVTALVRADGTPAWLASVDPVGGKVLMVPVPGPADGQGRVPELWLIPAGEGARSLGLVSIDRSHTVAVPQALHRSLAAGAVLAITLEPPGGAPAGVATGPIIAKGEITLG